MNPTLAAELRDAASDSSGCVFLRTTRGELTYAQVWSEVVEREAALHSIGVRPGDAVALLMRTDIPQVILWFALSSLGALHVPIDPSLKGKGLTHALRVANVRLVLADDDIVPNVLHATRDAAADLHVRAVSDLSTPDASDRALSADSAPDVMDPLSTATLLFTSGTTGPPKACALSHRYLIREGQLHAKHLALRASDVLYCPFPLFHVDAATLTVSAALAVRATAALGPRFSASGFWDEVRTVRATVFNFMGATLTMLWKRPPAENDLDHQVRLAWGVPMPEWQAGFEKRFGIPLRQVYGLTDAGICVYDPVAAHEQRPGYAGRVIEEYDVEIDESQRRAGDPPGVGEILVRGREPGLVMNGYYGDAEATAATMAAGWVRTGDLGELDDEGYLAFHGRLSDSIRRRGQNISAFEVEELVASHPDVVEAAAVGVPSDLTEEDVLVCVVRRADATLEAGELVGHCRAHGPAYMAPRYVRFMPALPKTPTEKIQKKVLREAAVTFDTWDADADEPAPGAGRGHM